MKLRQRLANFAAGARRLSWNKDEEPDENTPPEPGQEGCNGQFKNGDDNDPLYEKIIGDDDCGNVTPHISADPPALPNRESDHMTPCFSSTSGNSVHQYAGPRESDASNDLAHDMSEPLYAFAMKPLPAIAVYAYQLYRMCSDPTYVQQITFDDHQIQCFEARFRTLEKGGVDLLGERCQVIINISEDEESQ